MPGEALKAVQALFGAALLVAPKGPLWAYIAGRNI